MSSLPTEWLDRFRELIHDQCSLRFSPARQISLETRLHERLAARGITSWPEYFELLQENPQEFRRLIDTLTTKQTSFFRLPEQWQALQRKVLPEIEEGLAASTSTRVGSRTRQTWNIPLRLWSAGCATGEEAYTLAMVVREGLRHPRAWQTEILASDISQEALAAAAAGFYETERADKIPVDHRRRYTRSVEGGIEMDVRLKGEIAFRLLNLCELDERSSYVCTVCSLTGEWQILEMGGRFDVIFCRNVMIYFDFASQQQLVDNLFACLKPGGYLFTGDAELLRIYRHGFETLEYGGSYYYRKPMNRGI